MKFHFFVGYNSDFKKWIKKKKRKKEKKKIHYFDERGGTVYD